jgi:signal transduction histidine kinase
LKVLPDTDRSDAPAEIEAAMQTLARVSGDLLESYGALARRAERVEAELCRANAELERKVAELAAILDALPIGVLVRDAAGRIVRANGPAAELVGAIGPELDAGAEGERDLVRPDGRRLALSVKSSPIHGEAAGSVQILDDRTELVELSERLHGLDKLAALGNMAGGIAHELRNPMNAVKGFAALLARRMEPGSREHGWARMIVEGVEEADSILTSMLTLAAPERLARERIEGGELLAAAVECASRDAAPEAGRSAWSIEAECGAPPFEADRIQLRQAIRNLVANAIEAQPGGGHVRVSLALEEGSEIVVRVTDAGPGIPAELRRRVLDPFFTTRPQGTGLGLALVGTIARLHGGRVDVSPNPAPLGGADVSLRIPFRPAA